MGNKKKNKQEQRPQQEPPHHETIKYSTGNERPDQENKPSKPLPQRWWNLSLDKRIEIGIGIIGLIVAIVLAITAYYQLNAMQAQLTEMKSGSEDTKTIAQSAKTQADTAKKLADAAAASTAAWIVTDGWGHKIGQDGIVFEIVLKNVGKTASIGTSFGTSFTFLTGPTLDRVPIYEPFSCPAMSARPGIIPPDARIANTITNKPYSVDQLRLIAEGKARVFIHGCVIYHDVLSDKERITEIGTIFAIADKSTSPFIIYEPYNRMK